MSRGKYSVLACKHWPDNYEYKYNCYGEIPPIQENRGVDVEYDSKLMFADYDEEGYDRYGYSAFTADGVFAGHGRGVDREGWTEMDYLTLQDIPEEHRESYWFYNS